MMHYCSPIGSTRRGCNMVPMLIILIAPCIGYAIYNGNATVNIHIFMQLHFRTPSIERHVRAIIFSRTCDHEAIPQLYVSFYGL